MFFFSALAFVWLNKVRIYPPELHAGNIDAEWPYRKLFPAIGHNVYQLAYRINKPAGVTIRRTSSEAEKSMMRTRTGRFSLAASSPTGSMVFCIALILGAYLLVDGFY